MTTALRTHVPSELAARADRPTAVPQVEPALLSVPDHGDRFAGRGAVFGGAIGFVLMTLGVFILAMANDLSAASSIGVGLFCAFWGGLGFGAMMGSVLGLIRGEQREAAAAKARSLTTPTDRGESRLPRPPLVH